MGWGFMSELFEWIRINSVAAAAAATVGASFIALCGVVLAALVAFITGRRSVYISSVTAERSKWIEKLRTNIADLLGVCSAIHLSTPIDIAAKEQRSVGDHVPDLERRHHADRLVALITLQLNPNDESGIDRNLIIHMRNLVGSAEKLDKSYRVEEKKFIRHCQFLLKEEWEKVKSEARGTLKSIVSQQKRKTNSRKADYLAFYVKELEPRMLCR